MVQFSTQKQLFLNQEIVIRNQIISGSRNCRIGAFSESRNPRNGRQILYAWRKQEGELFLYVVAASESNECLVFLWASQWTHWQSGAVFLLFPGSAKTKKSKIILLLTVITILMWNVLTFVNFRPYFNTKNIQSQENLRLIS